MSRVIYTPSEPQSLKKISRRRSRRTAHLVLLVFVLTAVLTGLAYFIHQPYLRIKRIEFSGTVVLNENELREEVKKYISGDYFRLIPKDFYLMVSSTKLAKNLTEVYPRIENIKISKNLSGLLKIKITERKLFGIACQNESEGKDCYFIDQNGVAYEQAPNSLGSLIIKIDADLDKPRVGKRILVPELLEKLTQASEESRRLTGATINSYNLLRSDSKEIRGLNSDGYKVYLNREDDFKKVFGILKTVLEKEIKDKKGELDYVDLRFENKVFYKFKAGGPPVSNPKPASGTTTPVNIN